MGTVQEAHHAWGLLEIHHQVLPTGVVGGISLEEPEAGLVSSLASLDAQPGCWQHKMPCVLLPVLPALLSGQHRQAAGSSTLSNRVLVFTFSPSRVCIFLSPGRPVAVQPLTLGVYVCRLELPSLPC